MKRTIGDIVGEGSVNHNSRVFVAKNVDGERTKQNINFCNDNIKYVYRGMADEAVQRNIDRQTGSADTRLLQEYTYFKLEGTLL